MQHTVNCRLCRAVVVPDAIPEERLYRYGARGKVRAYEGLKEEYYLADFEPDEAVLAELGLDRAKPIVVVRTPPEVSLYHRFENDLFRGVLERLRGHQAVVLPRTPAQREELARAGGFVVPERAIDAQSLIAFSDLVISAGGTMNREAVALGTPVYTTFEGRLGAVDELLLREGRMQRLSNPDEIAVEKRQEAAAKGEAERLAEAEKIMAIGKSTAEAYELQVKAMGGDNFTRYKITEEIAKGNIKIIPDILIGAGTGTDGGINGLLGMKLMEMMDT